MRSAKRKKGNFIHSIKPRYNKPPCSKKNKNKNNNNNKNNNKNNNTKTKRKQELA